MDPTNSWSYIFLQKHYWTEKHTASGNICKGQDTSKKNNQVTNIKQPEPAGKWTTGKEQALSQTVSQIST